jgi:hypothetical protein
MELSPEDREREAMGVEVGWLLDAVARLRPNAYRLAQGGLLELLLSPSSLGPLLSNAENPLHRPLLRLVERLGAEHMTLMDLRQLFALLRGGAFPLHLLRALMRLAQQAPPEAPTFFVQLTAGGAVESPALPERNWPPTRGWSIAAWLRIEYCRDAQVMPLCLITLRSAHVVLRLEWQRRHLALVLLDLGALPAASSSSSTSIAVSSSFASASACFSGPEAEMREGRWYHVAVVHKPAEGRKRARAVLFLDGLRRARAELPLPRPHASQISCFLGRPVEAALGADEKRAAQQQLASWQIGNVFAFDEVLRGDEVLQLWRLGSCYLGLAALSSPAGESLHDCLRPQHAMALEARAHRRQKPLTVLLQELSSKGPAGLAEKVIFVFSARNVVFAQAAAARSSGPLLAPAYGRLLGDAQAHRAGRLRELLQDLGGLANLVYACAVLHEPQHRLLTLRVLQVVMRHAAASTRDMRNLLGFDLLGLLARRQRWPFTHALLDAFTGFVGFSLDPQNLLSAPGSDPDAAAAPADGVDSEDEAAEDEIQERQQWADEGKEAEVEKEHEDEARGGGEVEEREEAHVQADLAMDSGLLLHMGALRALLFEFRMWRDAEEGVGRAVLERLEALLDPARCRCAAYNAARCLEAGLLDELLFAFEEYSADLPPDLAPLFQRLLRALLERAPSPAQLQRLADYVVSSAGPPGETRPATCDLHRSSQVSGAPMDPRARDQSDFAAPPSLRVCVLQLLCEVLAAAAPTTAATLVEALPLETLLALLRCEVVSLSCLCFQTRTPLSAAVQALEERTWLLWLLDGYLLLPAEAGLGLVAQFEKQDGFLALAHTLRQFSVSEELLAPLFAILLGRAAPAQVLTYFLLSSSDRSIAVSVSGYSSWAVAGTARVALEEPAGTARAAPARPHARGRGARESGRASPPAAAGGRLLRDRLSAAARGEVAAGRVPAERAREAADARERTGGTAVPGARGAAGARPCWRRAGVGRLGSLHLPQGRCPSRFPAVLNFRCFLLLLFPCAATGPAARCAVDHPAGRFSRRVHLSLSLFLSLYYFS